MSGRKESDFVLARVQEEKLALIQRIAGLHSEVGHLKERLAGALRGAPAGLRSTFQTEAAQAERWLRTADVPDHARFGTGSDLGVLREACGGLDRTAAAGRRAHEDLTVAFTQKADALGKRLAQQLAVAEQLLLGRRHVLELWFGEAQAGSWERDLESARRQIEQRSYAAAEPALAALQQVLDEKGRHADDQEAKHQRRDYLVKALQEVCVGMGFKECEPPHAADPADRGGRMLYKVDTLDRGQIAFAITLETVHSSAAAGPDHCFEEFDKLSKSLNDQFGIKTEFKYSDGRPRPELNHKEQKAEPRTQGRSARQGT